MQLVGPSQTTTDKYRSQIILMIALKNYGVMVVGALRRQTTGPIENFQTGKCRHFVIGTNYAYKGKFADNPNGQCLSGENIHSGLR